MESDCAARTSFWTGLQTKYITQNDQSIVCDCARDLKPTKLCNHQQLLEAINKILLSLVSILINEPVKSIHKIESHTEEWYAIAKKRQNEIIK